MLDKCNALSLSGLSIRCSVAAKLGELPFDRSLKRFFEFLEPTPEQLRDAYLRLGLSYVAVTSDRRPSDVQPQMEDLFNKQLATGGRAEPILRGLIHSSKKPWLALVCAFADQFSLLGQSDLLELIGDDQERATANKQLSFCREWSYA